MIPTEIHQRANAAIAAQIPVFPKRVNKKSMRWKGWTTDWLTAADFDKCAKSDQFDGYMVRLGEVMSNGYRLAMIDADVPDPELSKELYAATDETLGGLPYPVRVGSSPKFAIFCCIDAAPGKLKAVLHKDEVKAELDLRFKPTFVDLH